MDFRQTALTELLKILEKNGIITAEQSQMIRVRQGIIKALVKKEKLKGNLSQRYDVDPIEVVMASGGKRADGGAFDEEQLVEIWAKEKSVVYHRIDPLRLDAKMITEAFSQSFARMNVILPLWIRDNVLTVATNYPNNTELVQMIRSTTRYQNVDMVLVITGMQSDARLIEEVKRAHEAAA